MKFKIILIIFFFTIVKSQACSCNPKFNFVTKEDLKEYDFIAHVKINGITDVKDKTPDEFIHLMSFNILELYKGIESESIYVYGANQILKGWTSCDLGERIGDEWIIFGYKNNNKLQTGFCTRSKRIKDSDGYENLSFPKRLTLKKKLQLLFDKEVVEEIYNESKIEFYKNGNKKIEESYKKNKLNGIRKIWYPNGNLQTVQNYKKGYKNGVFKWYSKNGSLIKIEKFKKNINIDTTTIWKRFSLSALSVSVYSDLNNVTKEEALEVLLKKRIRKQSIYNKKGNTLYSVSYHSNGWKSEEFKYDKKTKKSTYRYYSLEGKLKSERITFQGVRVSEKEWNKLDVLTKHKIYDKSGKLIKETSM